MKLSHGLFLILLSATAPSWAHPGGHPKSLAVIPQAEEQNAAVVAPSQTRHVTAQDLGMIELSNEFEALKGRMLRARLITIERGGSVAWHEHQQRPGLAYLINGSLVETRDEGQGPRKFLRRQGDAVFESTGVLHGWKNISSVPVTTLVVDLIPEE